MYRLYAKGRNSHCHYMISELPCRSFRVVFFPPPPLVTPSKEVRIRGPQKNKCINIFNTEKTYEKNNLYLNLYFKL